MSPDGLIEEQSIHVPHTVLIYIVLRSFKSCLCAAADNFPHFHAKRTFMSRLSITVIIFLVFNFGIEIKKSIINKSWYWSRVSYLPKMITACWFLYSPALRQMLVWFLKIRKRLLFLERSVFNILETQKNTPKTFSCSEKTFSGLVEFIFL